MSRTDLRALVLSAGLGTRLRPLTWHLPKPLLPVCGRAVVEHSLAELRLAGCGLAILNLHHLGEEIRRYLGDEWHGLPLAYSPEDPIQGTLGALAPVRRELRDADAVVVVNGDTLCPWPVESVVRRHLRDRADVTLLVHEGPAHRRAPRPDLGAGIAVDASGRVVGLREHPPVAAVGKVRRHVFAGLHVLRPDVLERVPEGPGDVIDGLYQPLLEEGADLRAVRTRRRWHDLGTPARYLEGVLDHARGIRPPGLWSGRRVAEDAAVDPTARLRRTVVERGAEIGAGARLDGVVVLPGASIGEKSRLERAIVGPGVAFPAGSELEGKMLTRKDSRHRLREGESVLGELVYTPL